MLYPQFQRSYQPSSPHLGSVRLPPDRSFDPQFKDICFSADALAQLLTVPPYVVAAVVMLSLSYASDKLQSRGIFLCVGCSLGGIGYLYVVLWTSFVLFRPILL